MMFSACRSLLVATVVLSGCGASIFTAIETSDEARIRALVAEDPAVLTRHSERGSTPLTRATCTGRAEMVRLLLELGAKINKPDSDGETSLHCAARNGNMEMVTLLLQNGADPGVQDSSGRTAAEVARDWQDSLFLSLYPDKDGRFEAYKSIFLAAREHDPDAILKRLSTGIDINAVRLPGGVGALPFLYQKEGEDRYRTALALVRSGYQATKADVDRLKPSLREIVKSADVATFEALLRGGLDPDTQVEDEHPLATVLRLGYLTMKNDAERRVKKARFIRMLDLLLQAGVSPNTVIQDGVTTPLHYACDSSLPPEMAELLLAHGADIKARVGPDKDQTVLHSMGYTGNGHCLKLLLAAGMDIDAPDGRGSTPLMWAVAYQKIEFVKLLLDHGADPTKKDHKGHTVLRRVGQNAEMKALLSKHVSYSKADLEWFEARRRALEAARLQIARDREAARRRREAFRKAPSPAYNRSAPAKREALFCGYGERACGNICCSSGALCCMGPVVGACVPRMTRQGFFNSCPTGMKLVH